MYTIELSSVTKTYKDINTTVEVLKDVSIKASPGETISIIGNSGSGKTTLLQIMGLIDTPTSGQIFLNSHRINNEEKKLLKFRRAFIGYMYQDHNLIKELTAIENIMVPLLIMGTKQKDAKEQAVKILDEINLMHCGNKYPNCLSGGEKQRISLARAMSKKPLLMLADEPTGNLDEENSNNVFCMIKKLSESYGTTTIAITHSSELAKTMQTRYKLTQGKLVKL